MIRHRRRNMGRVIAVALLLLVALPTAAVLAFVLLFDPNAHKARVEEAVRRATGRDFAIHGALSIASFLTPTLAADDVTLGNPDGFSRPEMARFGRVEADLALTPLLRGRVEIARLVLLSPDVRLERDASGRDNWHFARAVPAPAPEGASPGAGSGAPPVIIRTVHIRDGRLSYADAATGRDMTLDIKRLGATTNLDAQVTLAADLAFGAQRVQADGRIGSLARLLDRSVDTPYGIALTMQSQGARLMVTGNVTRPLEATGYDLRLEGAAPDLSVLSPLSPVTLPPMRNVVLSGQFSDAGGTPQITALSLRAGAGDLDAYVPGLKMETAELTAPGIDQPMRGEFRGLIAGEALRVNAALGAPGLLLRGGEAFPVDASVTLGGSVITAKGAIAEPGRLAGMDIALSAEIADLQRFAPLLGRRLPVLRSLVFTGRMVDGPPGGPGATLRDIALRLPQGDLAGEVAFSLGDRPSVRADLHGRRVELDPLLAAFAGLRTPPPAVPTANALPTGVKGLPLPRLLISDDKLPLEALDRFDADLHLTWAELLTGDVTYRDVAGHAVLRDGKLAVEPLSAQLPGGRTEVMMAVDARSPEAPVSLRVAAPALAVKPLLAAFGRLEDVSGTMDVQLDLRGAGRSWHDIAASLDGFMGLALVDGEIDNALLAPVVGNMLRVAKLPIMLDGPGRTKLRCVALRFDAAKGVATSSALVIDAVRLLVQGAGHIDLRDETLLIRLRPMVRAGNQGLVVPVRVEGTLRQPKFGLDAAAATGAAAGLLGRGDVVSRLATALAGATAAERGGDACGPALAVARGTQVAANPAPPPPAAPPLPNPAGLLRGLLR